MSSRYAREYLCPDPDEHGELVYVPGILRGDWRSGRQTWTPMADVPTCPICGAEMVWDNDDRPPLVEVVLVHRDAARAES
jgi:hypothetical protein